MTGLFWRTRRLHAQRAGGGKTWNARAVIAPGGWCPTAVWDAQRKAVVVQYSRYTDDSMRAFEWRFCRTAQKQLA